MTFQDDVPYNPRDEELDGEERFDDEEIEEREFTQRPLARQHQPEQGGGNIFVSTIEAFKDLSPKQIALYVLLFVVVAAVILGGLFYLSGEDNGQPGLTETPIPTPVPEVKIETPETPRGPQQEAELSSDLVSLRISMMNVGKMLINDAFILLSLINMVVFYQVFKDSINRDEMKDFKIFAVVMILVFISAILPGLKMATIPGSEIVFKQGGSMGMQSVQNTMAALAGAAALLAISISGRKDFTPIGMGLFVMGTFFWLTQMTMFMNWELPLETKILWFLGIIITLVEVARHDNAVNIVLTTAVAFVLEVVFFLFAVEGLEFLGWYFDWAVFVKYGQITAMGLTLTIAVALLGGLVGIKDQSRIAQQSERRAGRFTNRLVTAAPDATGLFLFAITIFIYLVWH